jgi:hypothetical protein
MEIEEMQADRGEPGRRLPPSAPRHGKKLLVAVGAATAVALAAGGVVAATSAGGPTTAAATLAASPAPTPAEHPLAAHPRLRRLLRRTVHAEIVLRAKPGALKTFDYDRGVLRSVSSAANTISIAPADAPNSTVSAAITAKTRFRGIAESQLGPGDRVGLLQSGGDAVLVVARPPKSPTTTS